MSADAFVTRMMVLYGPPNSADDDAFLAELRDMLSGYGKAVLDRAGSSIRDSHSSPFWPTMGVINAAVRKAAMDLAPPKVIPRAERENLEPPTPEQAARALALVEEMKRNMADSGRLTISQKSEAKPWFDTSRQAFERMQRESPNQELHRKPRTLSEISRRMSGDAE